MSWAEDNGMDIYDCEDFLNMKEATEIANRRIWRTKDGIKIPIKDMDDNHLANALKFCERNGMEAWETVLDKEIKR